MDSVTGKILIIDDDQALGERLHAYFTQRKHRSAVAHTGQRALNLIARVEFDLILIDLAVADPSAYQVIRTVRQKWSKEKVPIIAMSAAYEYETVRFVLSIGANDWMTKPLIPELLDTHVQQWLRGTQRSTTREASGLFQIEASQVRKTTATHCCSRCKSVVQPRAEACGQCGFEPKRAGWLRIVQTEYHHLGQTVGDRYFLDRWLGGGATASVYRARDQVLRRSFAVKVVDNSSDQADVPQAMVVERTKAEIQAMARLQNPHVVKIYDVIDIRDGVYALVMDYVRGKTLGSLLKRMGRLKLDAALQIARQVAQGLYEAHQFGMTHRDIKPDNIMVEKLPAGGLFARVLDFGVVHMDDNPVDLGEFVGTPLYCAPEQIRNQQPDQRTDIYALGTVLFHAISGRPPYDATNYVMILQHHVNSPVPAVSSVVRLDPAIARPVDILIRRMMAKDPNDRIGTMYEVIQTIDRLLRKVEVSE